MEKSADSGLLFIIKALNGIPLKLMINEIWLQIGLLLIVLGLITYVPDLVLFIPRAAGMME